VPDVVTFDGPTLTINEIPNGVDNTLDVIEVYSEWKIWAAQSDNLKYPPAFRVIGGDTISPTQNAGSTFFLNVLDGWSFVPADLDHQITLVGNIVPDGGAGNIFSAVPGRSVTARINFSNLVDSSVARLDLTQLLQAVYLDQVSGVAGTGDGVGTPTMPVNNLADAFAIATRDSLREFAFRGTLSLDQDYEDWTFTGLGAFSTSTVVANGWSLNGSKLVDLVLTGEIATGSDIQCERVGLTMVRRLRGGFLNCMFLDELSVDEGGFTIFADCYSGVPGTSSPICRFEGTGSSMNFRAYSGGIQIEDMVAGNTATVDVSPGTVKVEASCTGGSLNARGIGRLEDRSAGTAVTNLIISQDDVGLVREIHSLLGLDPSEELTIVQPTGDGVGNAGSQTVSGITLQLERQGGGATVVVRRLP
jgi:hypothetical protein